MRVIPEGLAAALSKPPPPLVPQGLSVAIGWGVLSILWGLKIPEVTRLALVAVAMGLIFFAIDRLAPRLPPRIAWSVGFSGWALSLFAVWLWAYL